MANKELQSISESSNDDRTHAVAIQPAQIASPRLFTLGISGTYRSCSMAIKPALYWMQINSLDRKETQKGGFGTRLGLTTPETYISWTGGLLYEEASFVHSCPSNLVLDWSPSK